MQNTDPPEVTTARLLPVRHAIAAEVRAEMARQNRTLRDIAPVLGIHHSGLALRVKGDIAFRAEELVALANALCVHVDQFVRIPAAADAAGAA